MEIEFDSAKAQSNWHKHGVSFAHAQAALQDAFAVTIEDPDAFGEQRFLTLGMDALGRVLVVCHTHAESGRVSYLPARPARAKQETTMREEYDFSQSKRCAVLPSPGKTRVTIMLDDDVIEAFRARADAAGKGYQTMVNEALRAAIDPESAPVTLRTLRAVLDERLHLAA